jgi:AraC-like DNA-binding protein
MSKKRHTVHDEAHLIVRSLAAVGLHGRAIAPHAHPWHQLIYAASGVMTVWTTHGSWVVPPRWAIWAPAGVTHGMTFSGSTSLRTLYLRPTEWPNLPAQSAVIGVSTYLRELILRAVEIGMLDRRDALHVALAALIVDAFRAQPVASLDLPLPTSTRLQAITEDLLRMPSKPTGAAHAARRGAMSVRSFERRFAEETGMTFGRWRRQARLIEALRRLAAGEPVSVVAEGVGYRSPSAFVDAFSRVFGTTPGRYFGH